MFETKKELIDLKSTADCYLNVDSVDKYNFSRIIFQEIDKKG